MISINDVTKIDDRRRQIKKEIYKKIYEQFARKIRKSVEFGNKQIFLTIPTFVIGYTVVGQVTAGVITSSSVLIRLFLRSGLVSIDNARRLAEEPEFTMIEYFVPTYFANSVSNFFTLFPIVVFNFIMESNASYTSSASYGAVSYTHLTLPTILIV